MDTGSTQENCRSCGSAKKMIRGEKKNIPSPRPPGVNDVPFSVSGKAYPQVAATCPSSPTDPSSL